MEKRWVFLGLTLVFLFAGCAQENGQRAENVAEPEGVDYEFLSDLPNEGAIHTIYINADAESFDDFYLSKMVGSSEMKALASAAKVAWVYYQEDSAILMFFETSESPRGLIKNLHVPGVSPDARQEHSHEKFLVEEKETGGRIYYVGFLGRAKSCMWATDGGVKIFTYISAYGGKDCEDFVDSKYDIEVYQEMLADAEELGEKIPASADAYAVYWVGHKEGEMKKPTSLSENGGPIYGYITGAENTTYMLIAGDVDSTLFYPSPYRYRTEYGDYCTGDLVERDGKQACFREQPYVSVMGGRQSQETQLLSTRVIGNVTIISAAYTKREDVELIKQKILDAAFSVQMGGEELRWKIPASGST